MPGAGMDMGIGQGAAMAGSLMNAFGQAQGFRALAAAKKRQREEQDAIQAEDNKDLGVTIQNNNPWLTAEREQFQATQPSAQYLESVRDIAPVGLSVSQRTAIAPQQEANQAELQAANERLGAVNGDRNTATGLRLSQAEFDDRRGGRKAKARRLAALYDLEDTMAAQRGEGLRSAGNMLTVAGGAAGSMGGPPEEDRGSRVLGFYPNQ